MIETILKRDGNKQKFESYKIEDAIKKAFKSVNTIRDLSVEELANLIGKDKAEKVHAYFHS